MCITGRYCRYAELQATQDSAATPSKALEFEDMMGTHQWRTMQHMMQPSGDVSTASRITVRLRDQHLIAANHVVREYVRSLEELLED